MDPKFFAAVQQGMNMNNQQNPNMMLPFQQHQQQQQQQPDMQQQLNALTNAGLGGMPFNPASFAGGMNFGQTDFTGLDQPDLNNMNPFLQANQPLMGGMNMNAFQQQQQLRQAPQPVYSPQNMMPFPGNNPAAQFQNRNMYQNIGNIMPNTPQALMLQQQQQQAALAMNRAKQSPSQSPALNNTHFPGNPSMGSPVVGNSPHTASGRMSSEFNSSPMNPNAGSPVQNFQQGSGISPSPQMARVIPSQGNNRYIQQQNTMNDASPSLNNMSSVSSYNSPQQRQQQPQPQPQQPQHQPQQMPDSSMTEGQMVTKNYNRAGYVQQQPSMQTQSSSPSHHPRQSVTPGGGGSTHSTPHQTPQQLDNGTSTPHMSPTVSTNLSSTTSPSNAANGNQQVTYIPKTRNVETYGGVDLKYFDKFEIKPLIPHLNELGVVDIQAIIMSLKSGMKMEVTNALNILTVLSAHQPPQLPLAQCDDLLDTLLDYLEEDIFGTCSRYEAKTSKTNTEKTMEQDKPKLTYTDLFDMSLDEMKSLIPQLENSTSDVWMSLRERCLCIFNLLRNFSFMVENIEYLARHRRLVTLLANIIISGSSRMDEGGEGESKENEALFIGIRRMDTLEFRKSILIIFSNISMFLNARDSKTVTALIGLIHDFLVNGPDTYYSLLAIETWTKLTVNYDNRQLLHALLVENEKTIQLVEDIWLELTTVIRRDFFNPDGNVMSALTTNQLAMLELAIIGIYNIVVVTQLDSLKQKLIQANKGIGMMMIRLCMTLAESGNPQFSLVTKRGMEFIRALICGGDGIRRRNSSNRQAQGQPRPLETLSLEQADDKDQPSSISETASRVLDMPVVREKLMLSMLKPTTDPEFLRELSDIVTLIDDDQVTI